MRFQQYPRTVTIGCLCFLSVCGCKKKPESAAPPEVRFITISATNVPILEEWIGSLEGYVNAQIRAQVTGYLLTQNYKEGSQVKKGDLLFQLDPRPFQASLNQAQAKLAQDQSLANKTAVDVQRYTPLAKEQAISQQELDNAVQANLSAVAQTKADKSAIETAQLNLGFTKIISPIDGLAGIALAQIGDLISPSSGSLTTISTLDPIKVYFNVSEQSYLKFWRRYTGARGTEPELELQLILSDGSIFPEKGKFNMADRQVSPTTGTLQIAGVFANPQLLLRPGQYGRVRAQTQLKTNAILVPQRAVAELQGGYQVAVVDDQNKTHLKPVKAGEQIGPNWIIEEGLKPGERLVVEGTQQAKEGTVVTAKPFERPVAPANPPAMNQAPAL